MGKLCQAHIHLCAQGADDFDCFYKVFSFIDINGDIDEDGEINVSDVVVLVDIILNLYGYNSLADLNQDGVINIGDIVLLVEWILDN